MKLDDRVFSSRDNRDQGGIAEASQTLGDDDGWRSSIDARPVWTALPLVKKEKNSPR